MLWSLPRFSSLRAGCQSQAGLPSVSLLFQVLRHKYPTSTAMSPRKSDHSLHLQGGKEKHVNTTGGLFGFPHFLKLTLLQLYMSSFHHTYFTIVNRTWRLWGNAAQVFLRNHLNALPCHLCLHTNTIVFALHKALPLSEPLHADAQDYCWSLLCLELFVQLQVRQQAHLFGIQHKALKLNSYRICLPWWKCLFPSFCV